MRNKTLPAVGVLFGLAISAPAQLLIDFNSTSQDGGPHNQAGYQSYNAGHEVSADFITRTYSAFGASVSPSPTWPNSAANTVRQMIDRGAGNDSQWLGTKIDLITDWLGTDTRPGQGGNGAYDGISGTPTLMNLSLGGLPAGTYSWLSYHHDTEHMWTPFAIDVSTDGGANFSRIGSFQMTDSSTGGTPDSGVLRQPGVAGQDPATLPSTAEFTFDATGSDDVVISFVPFSLAEGAANTHQTFFGINGFELTVVPEPSTWALIALGAGGFFFLRRHNR